MSRTGTASRCRPALLRRDGEEHPHRWEEHQRTVLKDAEEYDLLEAYEFALAQRDRQRTRGQTHV